jgi:hypothetical protein
MEIHVHSHKGNYSAPPRQAWIKGSTVDIFLLIKYAKLGVEQENDENDALTTAQQQHTAHMLAEAEKFIDQYAYPENSAPRQAGHLEIEIF